MIFDINLIKDRTRSKKRKSLLRIILYSELFLFLLTYFLLYSYYSTLTYKVKDNERALSSLNEDIIFLSGEGTTLSSIKEVNEKYAKMTLQISTINELTKNRILISHKLKGLSEVLPENMWIDKFYVKQEESKKGSPKSEKVEVIYLEGFVIADREEAFGAVQSLIRDMGANPLFSEGIEDIELSSISKPRVQSFGKIMEFKISCLTTKK